MKAVVQRVLSAELKVDGKLISDIGAGFVVYLGVGKGDEEKDADYIAKKIANLRVFEDENGKMNLSALNTNAEVLLVSQFTLYGDSRKGNRPSFGEAELPERANELYEYTAKKLKESGLTVKQGVFGADMKILQHCDGPVTMLLESPSKIA